ncbi:MAG: 4Fe-4S dicluster domain-containing protein [Prevotellaceae bacterium]|nr:4Fe-4S dicluster domain-containing protein [Prevotellaceae bacterium]
MLKKTRITLATLSFLVILLMFMDFSGAMRWAHWLTKLQLVPALLALNVVAILVVLALTLLIGRLYCSVICPLGILQDIIFSIGKRLRRKRKRMTYSPPKNWLRYTVLVLYVIAGVCGLHIVVALLDPYAAFGRMANNFLQPLYIRGNNLLATWAERQGSYAFYQVDLHTIVLPTLIAAVVTIVVIAILAWLGGRTYCNTICPVGSLLGLFSRYSLFKITVDEDKCVKCRKCERDCKASAINSKLGSIDYSRCVMCGDCIETCDSSALVIRRAGRKPAPVKTASDKPLNAGRRSFLLGTAMATVAVTYGQEKKKVDGGLATIEDKQKINRQTPLTPPGSFSGGNLANHCTACQLCVSACPNGVLQPSTSLHNLMQPTMSYENGYCRPECTRCSEVCPTGAIRRITAADKTAIHIGHAVWLRDNCVVLRDDVSCGNCSRHCPTGAITMVPLWPDNPSSRRRPAVDENKCIGCGACENLCPARPFSAIYVEGHEVHRCD